MAYVVYCEASCGTVCTNTHSTCAERRMALRVWIAAVRHGVRGPTKIARWIRRRYGIWHVERFLSDGTPGISIPCLLCRRVLDRLGVRWEATNRDGETVGSHDPRPPTSTLTRRQKKYIHC